MRSHYGALLICLLVVARSFGQENGPLVPEQDFGLWFSAAFETQPFMGKKLADRKFAKKLTSALEWGYRTSENVSNGRLMYTTLSTRYRFKKWLRFGLDHRVDDGGPMENTTHRTDIQASYAGEYERFSYDFRLNYQHEYEVVGLDDNLIRNRVGIEWNTRKYPLDPFAQVEAFTTLHYKGNYLSRMRYDIGLKWNMGNDHRLAAVYRHQREIGAYAPVYDNIISLSYEYFWDRKKK